MKTVKSTLIIALFCTILHTPLFAQVTIGSNEEPLKGSLLDLKQTNDLSTKGLLLPRVPLEKINQLFPMFGTETNVNTDYQTDKGNIDLTHTGLTVYNMTTDLDEGLCPGVYVWQADIWKRLPTPCEPNLSIENSPNSFFVKPGEAVEIPVGKPYLLAQEGQYDIQPINLTDKVTLELLWQDTQNLIDKIELSTPDKGPYSKFKVYTKSASTSGNALVALRMGPTGTNSDPIVWSWHIWVTDYDPNAGGQTYTMNNGEDNYLLMDRNLGAVSITAGDPGVVGLTYQWGRKDPFTGALKSTEPGLRTLYDINNATLTEVDELQSGTEGTGIQHKLVPEGSDGIKRSIQNPTVFYYGPIKIVYSESQGRDVELSLNESNYYDWLTTKDDGTAGDDSLWGTTTNKTAFDPCPKGWRVPANSASKSPWHALAEGTSSGWGGWDDDITYKGSYSREGVDYSSDLNIGFFPNGFFRAYRIVKYGYHVGGGSEYSGGIFNVTNTFDETLFAGFYWTAQADSNKSTAQTLILRKGFAGGLPGTSSYVSSPEISPMARSTGALVRCVKDGSNGVY